MRRREWWASPSGEETEIVSLGWIWACWARENVIKKGMNEEMSRRA
jgi:hypothetical protein